MIVRGVEMNKKKKYLIIGIVIVVVVIVAFVFVFKLKEDSKEMDSLMDNIIKASTFIDNNISVYNQNRDKLSDMLSSTYSNNLDESYQQYILILNEQEDVIEAIYQNVLDLSNDCKDRLFSDSKVNKACSNYKKYYETVVNVYLNDVEEVNELVRSYNEESTNVIEEYQTSYEYIDYDGDKEYVGRYNTDEEEE